LLQQKQGEAADKFLVEIENQFYREMMIVSCVIIITIKMHIFGKIVGPLLEKLVE